MSNPPFLNTHDGLTTRDGNRLELWDWPASADVARPAAPLVLLVHGLGEHAGRYAHLAARLNAAGYSVRAYDQYGHGKSSGSRGGLARDAQLIEHLGEIAAATLSLKENAGRPLVLIGHSLGGLVVASAVMRGLITPRLLVMSSPALAVDMAAWQRVAVKTIPKFAPNLTLSNGLDPQILSHDPRVVAEYLADPLVHDRICARLGAFVAHEGAAVSAQAASWSTPTLLLYAGDDRAVSPRGSKEFAAAAPSAVVSAQCFAQMYHEIFNEPDAEEVFRTLETALAAVG